MSSGHGLQAKTDRVKIYSYNSALGLSGKVFCYINVYDMNGEKQGKSTGQSGWTVLRDKKEVMHQLNNSIIDAINNYLILHGESPAAFFRYNKSEGNNAVLLKSMTDEYGIQVKLEAYKIMYQTDIANTLQLTKKRKFAKLVRNNQVIGRYKYDQIRKKDIKESFNEQSMVDVESEQRLYNKELGNAIKRLYKERRDADAGLE